MNSIVFAAAPWQGLDGPSPTIRSFETLFQNVITSVASLAIAALFIAILVAGFQLLFSGGDAKKTEQAKGALTAAILGIVLIGMATLILKTIQALTGVNVTTFTIPNLK